MKTFLPTLFALIGVAVIIGIIIAISKIVDSHYDYKVKHGSMSEDEAEKRKSSSMKATLIIAGIVLALLYVGATNKVAIDNARKEEREIAKEEWYQKGYEDGYSDGESDR